VSKIETRPTFTPPSEQKPDIEKPENRFTAKQRIIAAIAAVGIVGGAVVGFVASNNGEKPAEATASSAPADPTEQIDPTQPPVTGETDGETTSNGSELTVDSLMLDPNASPEEWGNAFSELLGSWLMAGANTDTYNRYMAFNGPNSEFVNAEAQKNASIFAEAIFGQNWMNNAGDVQMVNYYTEQNATMLQNYLATYTEEHPFEWENTPNSSTVVDTNGESTTVDITFTATNNSAENRVGTQFDPDAVALNGQVVSGEVVFTRSNEHVYVSSYTIK